MKNEADVRLVLRKAKTATGKPTKRGAIVEVLGRYGDIEMERHALAVAKTVLHSVGADKDFAVTTEAI